MVEVKPQELPEPTHFYDARSKDGVRGRVDVTAIQARNGTYAHVTYRYPGLNCNYKGPLLSRAGVEALIKNLRAIFPEEVAGEQS